MKQGKIRYVYPGGNTPDGFYSFYAENLSGLEHVFILKGGPGTGKSTLIRKVGIDLADRGFDIEFWQCSSDNNSLDGVLIRALSCAVVDGTAPHTVDPKYPGVIDEIINLGDHWDENALLASKDEIITLTAENSAMFASAYAALARAKDSFTNYKSELLDAETTIMLKRISGNLADSIFSGAGQVRHYFASAFTPQGWVGFAQSLSENYQKRYVVESANPALVGAILSYVAQTAEKYGHAAEIYHHPMDLACVELLLLPQLDVALISGNARGLQMMDSDIIVKIAGEKDDKADTSVWHKFVHEGCSCIAQAKSLHDKLEKCYIRAMDFAAVDEVEARLLERIRLLALQQENQNCENKPV